MQGVRTSKRKDLDLGSVGFCSVARALKFDGLKLLEAILSAQHISQEILVATRARRRRNGEGSNVGLK
jgi:hypothetical protein